LTYSSLIKPDNPIPSEASAIHGITDEMVVDAPTFAEIYPELKKRIEGRVFVAYNATYDATVMTATCKRNELEVIRPDKTYCAMKLASAYFEREFNIRRWQKLGAACKLMEVETDDSELHNALYDVQMTIALLRAIADRGE
jgi:DNA polymerase III epsilon subunit family exonuclease